LNPPGNKFCHECGAALAAAETPARPTVPSPEAYTPRHLAQRILSSRGVLEGERKQVTVLFADLKGSMELLADRDPEEARRILDPVLERMMEAVHRYEGTVNQVMGDGIMALFGAPLAHEDHAVRACYAALRVQDAVKQYADAVRRAEGVTVRIRVGLNSGEVVVRSIGSDLRMDYTAVGQTTHLAARMEQLAAPGSILLTPATLQLAEGYVQVKSLGPMPVKGLGEPIEVYEVLGAGLTRTRLQAAAARGLTRFVGREAEIETLRQALARAGAGHGQVVALVGEPGVGKSRLTWEFTHSHRAEGWLVLESGSVSYGRATSYLPVIELLRSYFQIDARDEPRRVQEKALGKLLALDRSLEPLLSAFLTLLDLPVEDPAWQALEPPQRRQRTLDALKRLLLRESQEQPLLLVFEDLHWIDTETQALLDSLVESLPGARVLLLVNYRPEYEHRWGSKTYYAQLRLDPLPPESAETLLQALLGDDPGLQSLTRLLIERTEGNPFYLEESVRTLVETGVLVGERGAYRLGKSVESTQVPATVQAVLAARIDRLAPDHKRVLQSAAVIGKDVPFLLLQAVVDEPEERLREGLMRLRAGEFLYETSLFPELEYTFKHALTHEVAYGGLLQERRRALHARIVEAIERLYADRLEEHVERLAHHAVRGELWDKALPYLRQAGAKATARSAHREAVLYLEQALAALAHLPDSAETRTQAIDVRFELRAPLVTLGDVERALDHLNEAAALASALDDQSRLGRVSAYRASSSWVTGDYERAVEFGHRAVAIATAVGDRDVEVQANHYLNQGYHGLGDFRRAAEFNRRNIDALQGERLFDRCGNPHLPSVIARCWLDLCLGELGEFAEGIARGEEALDIAGRADHPFSLAAACLGLGALHVYRGDFPRAISLLERGVEVCHARSVPVLMPVAQTFLGYAHVLSGRLPEGLSLLEQALGRYRPVGLTYTFSLTLIGIGEAHLQARSWDRAAVYVARALAHARDHKERGREAWALRLHGEVAAHADPPEVAVANTCYGQALALAEELGMRPLEAHCHRGLGELCARARRRDEARAELGAAMELYRGMGMSHWLGRAEAALAGVV
jgi:class 3 adenylate cyclase/tetratricopeptide (TPR) repeat protein